jgi:hypothetical protein
MTLYSFWHIVRQGWGIFALYRSREGERANVTLERTLFYVAMYAPYIYFLFVHPVVRSAMIPGAVPMQHAWELLVARVLCVIGVIAFGWFVVRLLRAGAKTALLYGSATILFHAIIYFVFSVREPIFEGAMGTDQAFMVITAAVSICHSTQYIALVFIHNARRYTAGASVHGLGSVVSAKALPYLATLLGFAILYVGLTWLTGIYPGIGGAPLTPNASPHLGVGRLALAIYWGIALQHYLLDARIWRIKTDPDLKKVFMAR